MSQENATTSILLIRHAQTEWNLHRRFQGHGDSPITPEGYEQLRCLRSRLAQDTFDAVFASDLPRTMRTAEFLPVAKDALQPEPRLRERGVGILEGLNLQEILRHHPRDYAAFKQGDKEHAPPQGESLQQAFDRAWEFCEAVIQQRAGQRIAAVSHAGLIRLLTKHILGIALDGPSSYHIPNTSLTQLEYSAEERRWTISTLADTTHLQPVFAPLVQD
jgi:probable phosphoglycerate mutase